MSDLEAELEKLNSALEEKGAELRYIIKEEKQRKEAELQVETLFLSGALYFLVYYLVLHIYLLIVFKVIFSTLQINNILHLMYIHS